MLIIDCKFFILYISKYIIKYISHFIYIRDLNNVIFSSLKYINFEFIFRDKFQNEKFIINKFHYHIHIINEFKINFFLKFNILNFKKININYN